jgi:uncharacterized protein (DUF2267 family)
MSHIQVDAFEATLQKTNVFLNAIQERFGWNDPQKAYQALRSVLHALRDRLTVEHVAGLAAQLPMLVRGFYYEGWRPGSAPKKMNREEFIDQVVLGMPNLDLDKDPTDVIRGVLAVVASYTTPEEMRKVWKTLPKDIENMLSSEGS